MTKTSRTTIIIALFIILAIFVYAFRLVFKTSSNQQALSPTLTQASGISFIDSSKIVWDAKTTIPGTGVAFSYPREGFYGQGVKLVNNQWSSDLFSFKEVESLYLISLPESSGSQQAYIRVFESVGESDLEKVMKKLGDEGGMPLQGRYEEINGTRYFLQPSGLTTDQPKVYTYTAYTITHGRLLIVNIQGGFDGSDGTVSPSLVVQFLAHLDLTCVSDCSANSAPIIDVYRGEQ